MVKCHSCISEEEAGMACLSCPCSSSPWGSAHKGQGPSTKEKVHLAQPARLNRLNKQQLQSLCSSSDLHCQDLKEPLTGRSMPRYSLLVVSNLHYL